MEQLDFTVVNNYKISQLKFNWTDSVMEITCIDAFGKVVTNSYSGAAATGLMNALNVANFSVKSLHRNALEYLVSTGSLPVGTIGGTP